MSMAPFHHYFRDRAFKEMRTVTVHDLPGLPNGEYGFIELYCADTNCDCRRVLINVVSPTQPGKILATINYGWESVAFYTKWLRNEDDAAACRGASLDPFNPQTIYAPLLLRLFETVLQDAAYVQRLRTHYALFKRALQEQQRVKRQPAQQKNRRRK
jgi:hypothetical protein